LQTHTFLVSRKQKHQFVSEQPRPH